MLLVQVCRRACGLRACGLWSLLTCSQAVVGFIMSGLYVQLSNHSALSVLSTLLTIDASLQSLRLL